MPPLSDSPSAFWSQMKTAFEEDMLEAVGHKIETLSVAVAFAMYGKHVRRDRLRGEYEGEHR